jgi:hypothetical protein
MTETSYAGADTERSQDQPTADAVMEKAHEVTSQVAEKASDLREQASSRARDEVNNRSTRMGEQVAAIAEALRRTSGQLREEGQSQPAQLAQATADRVERMGAYLHDADFDRMLDDAEAFARRQTWLVGAGGLVVGLVASRLLKASSSRRFAGSGGTTSAQSLASKPRSYGELAVGESETATGDAGRQPAAGV